MSAVKTIDVKGLDHAQKHEMIFPGIEALKPGDSARLVVEFNPKPLVVLLKSQGGLEVAYEKEGPDEWVLRVTRIAKMEDKKSLTESLTELQDSRPELFNEEKYVIELDLRQIMPFERHELIFQKWDALKQGETLKIINDHDPKPLRYQFEAEYKGQYEWEYDQAGPKDWMVRIKKV
ncbi:MAG: DUF2249 domain-containing protein [Chloroflexota bacterium]